MFNACEPTEAWTGGGANLIVFQHCELLRERLALRLSVVGASEARPAYFKIAGEVGLINGLQGWLVQLRQSGGHLHPEEDLIMNSLLIGMENLARIDENAVRRLIRPVEIAGEKLWRGKLSWEPLTFGVAMPMEGCNACFSLSAPMPTYSEAGEPLGVQTAVEVRAEVFRTVEGSALNQLSRFPSPEGLLVLIIGYVADVELLAELGLLHDCHLGNVLLRDVAGPRPVLKWHDFTRSLWTPDPSRETLDEFAAHVNDSFTTITKRLSETGVPRLGAALDEDRGECWLPKDIGGIRRCLRDCALAMISRVVDWHGEPLLAPDAKERILVATGRGFHQDTMESLRLRLRGAGPGDDTVVITVVHGRVTKEVEFSRASTAAGIKKAICLEVGIAVGTVIRLENDKGRGVAIDGSLKPGAYNVTVVPQAVLE